MSHIVWKESYEIGVAEVDNQHHRLIDLLNELYTAHQSQVGASVIENVLNELVDYTKTHFKDEEKLFDSSYFDADNHRKEHHEFIVKLNSLLVELKQKNLLLTYKTLDFLRDWTISHILGTDKELGYYLRKKTRI